MVSRRDFTIMDIDSYGTSLVPSMGPIIRADTNSRMTCNSSWLMSGAVIHSPNWWTYLLSTQCLFPPHTRMHIIRSFVHVRVIVAQPVALRFVSSLPTVLDLEVYFFMHMFESIPLNSQIAFSCIGTVSCNGLEITACMEWLWLKAMTFYQSLGSW